MDEDTQGEYMDAKGLPWLRKRMRKATPLLDLECSITTHEYPPAVERWVTQADLGLVLRFEDHLQPHRDWDAAVLLQAKRLYPDSVAGPYSLSSRYQGTDALQHQRAIALNRHLGYDLVRYLLYCPRPESFDKTTAAALRHLRDVNVGRDIFDYSRGLELHRNSLRMSPLMDAGLVVAPVESCPSNLRQTYEGLFSSSLPWAWFLTFWLVDGDFPRPFRSSALDPALHRAGVLLASGDSTTVREVTRAVDDLDDGPFPLLPAHTITIVATVGRSVDLEARDDFVN
jgi:hypothetical protein